MNRSERDNSPSLRLESARDEDRRDLKAWLGDCSGAFADLGTFLPLIIGVFAVQQLDPTGVLVGFGVFALAVALIYRRPVPVQPMKAVAAVVIAGSLTGSAVAASGALLGIVLTALGVLGVVRRLARLIPGPVLTGVQLGIGLYLIWAGAELIVKAPLLGIAALAGLLVFQKTPLKPLSALIVLAGAAVWGTLTTDGPLPNLSISLALPQWQIPDVESLWHASKSVLLPQLALTLTNATVITAAIAGDLFPRDKGRITPDRLALSTGVLNLVLAPFGAFPMCHGAGGLVVQHRFGARTGAAPALFGTTCLAIGLLLGDGALALLHLLPLSAVGALLLIAGTDLAVNRSLRNAHRGELAVILLTGLGCVAINVAVGLLAGLLAEWVRRRMAIASQGK